MDEPPGTSRTRSAGVSRRAGKVSLSMKLRTSPSDISLSSPRRNPKRIPCLTHECVTQRESPLWSTIFSAARIWPRVRRARKSSKTLRAAAGSLSDDAAYRPSTADFNSVIESGISSQTVICGNAIAFRSLTPFGMNIYRDSRDYDSLGLRIKLAARSPQLVTLAAVAHATHLHSLRISTPGIECVASRASAGFENGPCQRE